MRVYNKYDPSTPTNAVYIGRGSPWGNPFVIGKDGTREQVCAKYETWIREGHLYTEIKKELKGKDLVCFCAPKQCHGDFLLRIANE